MLLALEGTELAVDNSDEVEALEASAEWEVLRGVQRGDEGDEVELRKRNMVRYRLRARVMLVSDGFWAQQQTGCR